MSKAEDLAKEFLKKLVSHTTLYKDTIDELDVYEPDDVIWAYKEGYHQAEKDLDILSWVKEVSGVKELSRAKEKALKAYPPQSIAANYDTINRRDAFEYGYLKAEKGLELTWEDVKEIYCIALNFRDHVGSSVFGQSFYEEVLKRFKDFKERKEQ